MKKPEFKFGVKTRLTITFSLLLVVIIFSFFVYHAVKVAGSLSEAKKDKGILIAKSTAEKSSDLLLVDDIASLQQLSKSTLQLSSDIIYAYIQDKNGNVVGHTFGKGFPKGLEKVNIPLDKDRSIKLLKDPDKGLIDDIAYKVPAGGTVHVGISHTAITSIIMDELSNILITLIISILIVTGLAIVIAGQITKPLNDIAKTAASMGKGDLTEKIPWTRSDEFGVVALTLNNTIDNLKKHIQSEEEKQKMQENIVNFLNLLSSASEGDFSQKAMVTSDIFGSLGDAFNLMVEGLTDLMHEIKNSAEGVNKEGLRILNILKTMEDDAEMQMVEVKKATESVDEAAISSMNISDRTKVAQKISHDALTAVNRGKKIVLESIDGIQLIRVTIQSINKRMKYLSERLMEIGTISQLIAEISNRTNLLSINASIEAARAGEQGRGFVVIAEEIRALAERATKSTKQIGDIINSIQVESAEVTKHLEEETNYVETETRMAADTGTVFREIEKIISDIGSIISEISASATEQKDLTSKVVVSMEEVQRKSLQMLKLVHDFADISKSLSKTSNSVMSSLTRFKLPETKTEVLYD